MSAPWKQRLSATSNDPRLTRGSRRPRLSKAVVVAGYLAFAAAYVGVSDYLVHTFEDHSHHALAWQFGKEMFFCASSAALIFFLMKWYARQLAVARQEIEAGQRLRSLGEMSATIAHEFNNMVMGANVSMEVASRRVAQGSREAAALDQVRAAMARVQSFSQRILGITRPVHGELQPLELGGWIKRLTADAAAQMPEASLSAHVPPAELVVPVDATLLAQAILNLIVNARDAGGTSIEIRLECRAARAVIAVSDNGGGIPLEIRERLFQPLATTKSRGTGLGLPLVYSVVAEHGGELEVESTLGEGTHFRIFLPLAGSNDGP
jgi:two-component system, LuxR family, sensor kinase FixL